MEELMNAPQEEQITRLYSLIRQNPDLLPDIDKQLFADTPLHLAAGQRQTQLALEILPLMPSFGSKLDPDGLTPLHLAIRGRHADTVSAMVKLDPKLVRVHGREGITPLHYAAESNEVDILAEFLLICPDSIEDLTNRGESAVHVAAKNGSMAAVGVLLGWMERAARSEVLGWSDWEGNTVLHLMASFDQSQVIKKLIKVVPVNAKNSRGFTALDIAIEFATPTNKTWQILQQNGAESGSSIRENSKIFSYSDYLSSPMSMLENVMKHDAHINSLMSSQRDLLLLVATLIFTTTFQVGLSPPSGFNSQSTTNVTVAVVGNRNGKAAMSNDQEYHSFIIRNTIAFCGSWGMIYSALPISMDYGFLHVSLLFLMVNYALGIKIVLPQESEALYISVAACAAIYIIMYAKMLIREWNAFMKRYLGSLYFYNNHAVTTLVFDSKSEKQFDGQS